MQPVGLRPLFLALCAWWGGVILWAPLSAWLVDLSVVCSQTVNTLVLRGSPDETVSARCYRLREQPRWRTAYHVINAIFFWQADHCASSFATDVARALWLLQQHRPNIAADV